VRFASEWAFLLLLAVPALLLLYWAVGHLRSARLRSIGDAQLAARLVSARSERKSILKAALIIGAVLLLALALTRPQIGGKSTLVKREGIDILFVMDVSKSMLAEDIRPSRLKRAQLELQSLLMELHGDRVGIVSFAGAAFVQCPLTTDYGAARIFLKNLNPNDMPVQGTAIGDALIMAHQLLTASKESSASRLVVLLTDGEDHGKQLEESMAKLEADKIPVFVVGIGSASGEPIPEYGEDGQMSGYKKSEEGKTVMSRLNESLLSGLAEKSGGRYVSLQAGGSLSELHDYVKRMQKREFESSLYTQYDEKFPWLLWPAFLLLLAASLIDERRGSRLLGLR